MVMILAGKSLHLRMVCMLMTMGVSLSKSSVTGFQVKPHSCFSKLGILQSRRSFLLLSSTRLASTLSSPHETKRIAIVGGGLAGLSTVFHLLEQAINNSNSQEYTVQPPLNITVFDKSTAGSGGASSVAGGLVHPLSPRGKLVHWGREGIKETNYLVKQACAAVPDDKDKIVLRDEIFRLATSPNQAKQLQETAKNKNCEEFCEWMDRSQLLKRAFIDCDAAENVHGGLRLYNGCKVLHLPSYLKGLWAACEVLSSRSTDLCLQWEYLDLFEQDDTLKACKDLDHHYDTIIWAAGSGLFESEIVSDWLLQPTLPDSSRLPFQLVRGQSVEIRFPESSQMEQQQALLSGKYISPLPDPGVVLVGATHEFAPEPLSHSEVKKEMREKTQSFCPHVWGKGSIVERYTEGIRVQSQRGSKGRLPIVGKLTREDEDTNLVREHWIFTGLSSRGLLYHGVYGKLLAQAISEGSEKCIETQCHDFDWWKRSKPEVNDHVVPGS